MKRKQKRTTDAFGVSLEEERPEDISVRLRKGSYARHFEGYVQVPVLSPAGHKTQKTYLYAGALYRQELTESERSRLRVLHVVLYIMAVGLLVGASCLHVKSNSCWYVFMATIITGIFYVRQFFVLYAYLPAGQNFKVREFHDGAKILPIVTKLAAISICLPVVTTIVMFMLRPDAFSFMEIIRVLMLLLAAACIYISGRLEARVRYTEILPNTSGEQKLD